MLIYLIRRCKGARFGNTQVQGAKFRQSFFGVDFESIIKTSIKKEDDFDTLDFDNIADKKRILKGIVRGHYTEWEAQEWIAEYNDATNVVATVSG